MTNTPNQSQDTLEAVITRALEHTPEPTVPVDFAARVRASLPAATPGRVRPPLARIVSFVAVVMLTVALFVLAPHARPGLLSITFYVEVLLIVELGGISYWLATSPRSMD